MSHECQSILHDPNGRLLSELASVSAELAHGHVIPEHSHPEDQLLFASSGVMTLRTKQGVWVVPPMRAVWIPADTPHSVAMSGAVSMRTLYFLPKLCRRLRGKCFVMNVSALLRELILHACKFKEIEQERYGGATDYRNHRRPIEGRGFDPFAVAASDGHAGDARGEDAFGGSERSEKPGKTQQGLRREQENDSAGVSGRNEDEFREVAAATAAASWIAADGFGRKGDGSGVGGGLQQPERVHIDVPETARDDADAVFGGWEWTGAQ